MESGKVHFLVDIDFVFRVISVTMPGRCADRRGPARRNMRYLWLITIVFAALTVPPAPAGAATVTCEVRAVSGTTLQLVNCDQKRLKGFAPGDRVKVKRDKKHKGGR